MGKVQYRLATNSDNKGILNLTKRCPQEGMITFYINRTPEFNTLQRLLDPRSWHFVACDNDLIIGLVGVIHFDAKVLGQNRRIGYMLDLRLDKSYRSGLTAFRLIKTAIDYLHKTGIDMVVANFLKDNNRSLVFVRGRAGLPAACKLGENRVFNMISHRKMRLNKRFTVEMVSENDIPEIVELHNRFAAQYKIAPAMSEELLQKYFSQIKGMSTDSFLVAKENGKIKAIAGLWDEHYYKAYQVLKLNRGISLVNFLIKLLSPFLRLPQPIKLNRPLRQLSIAMYAHDNCPEALENLFRYINNTFRGPDYTLITLYAQAKDPVFRLLKKFTNVSVSSELHLFASDTEIYTKLSENDSPVLFDLTMTL